MCISETYASSEASEKVPHARLIYSVYAKAGFILMQLITVITAHNPSTPEAQAKDQMFQASLGYAARWHVSH